MDERIKPLDLQKGDHIMGTKIAAKGFTKQELKEELKEIKSWKSKEPKNSRLMEIAKQFASEHEWESALEALQYIPNEKERNLLIADLIEGYLLPAREIDTAKKFAKFLTPVIEMESLVWIRIALADKDPEEALKIAEHLPSPLSRNFAFLHIMESFLAKREKNKVSELYKLMIENIRTIYDSMSRCYVLRELALNLFLPHNEKELALETAMMIPDETIKTQVLSKINAFQK